MAHTIVDLVDRHGAQLHAGFVVDRLGRVLEARMLTEADHTLEHLLVLLGPSIRRHVLRRPRLILLTPSGRGDGSDGDVAHPVAKVAERLGPQVELVLWARCDGRSVMFAGPSEQIGGPFDYRELVMAGPGMSVSGPHASNGSPAGASAA